MSAPKVVNLAWSIFSTNISHDVKMLSIVVLYVVFTRNYSQKSRKGKKTIWSSNKFVSKTQTFFLSPGSVGACITRTTRGSSAYLQNNQPIKVSRNIAFTSWQIKNQDCWMNCDYSRMTVVWDTFAFILRECGRNCLKHGQTVQTGLTFSIKMLSKRVSVNYWPTIYIFARPHLMKFVSRPTIRNNK